MSSVVIYSTVGVVAEWNKSAPYSVRVEGEKTRTYRSAEAATRAARRVAKKREG